MSVSKQLVDVSSLVEGDDESEINSINKIILLVFDHLDPADDGLESELSDHLKLRVVPKEYLVHGPLRAASGANEGYHVCSIEKFSNANASFDF